MDRTAHHRAWKWPTWGSQPTPPPRDCHTDSDCDGGECCDLDERRCGKRTDVGTRCAPPPAAPAAPTWDRMPGETGFNEHARSLLRAADLPRALSCTGTQGDHWYQRVLSFLVRPDHAMVSDLATTTQNHWMRCVHAAKTLSHGMGPIRPCSDCWWCGSSVRAKPSSAAPQMRALRAGHAPHPGQLFRQSTPRAVTVANFCADGRRGPKVLLFPTAAVKPGGAARRAACRAPLPNNFYRELREHLIWVPCQMFPARTGTHTQSVPHAHGGASHRMAVGFLARCGTETIAVRS